MAGICRCRVSATDIPPADYKINISAMRASNLNNLMEKYDRFISMYIDALRRKSSFRQYLFQCFQNKIQEDFLIYPKLKQVVTPEGKLWSPENEDQPGETAIASYKRTSFSLLF